MQFEATMTTRGRVTIPKAMREALDWRPHDKIEFELEDGEVTLRNADPSTVHRQTPVESRKRRKQQAPEH